MFEKTNRIAITLLLALAMVAAGMAAPLFAAPAGGSGAYALEGPAWGFDSEYAGGLDVEEYEGYDEHGWGVDFAFDVPEGEDLDRYVAFALTDEQGGPADEHIYLAEHAAFGYIELNVTEGLAAREDPYTCRVEMYYDPTGSGNFGGTPYKQGVFRITISAREFAFKVNEPDAGTLHEGYDAQQAGADLVVTNIGTQSLQFSFDGLAMDAADPFTALFPERVTVAPGESKTVATIRPKTGQPVGDYWTDFTLTDTSGTVSAEGRAHYVVARPGLFLEAAGGPVYFGILPLGSTDVPGAEWVYLDNTGDAALAITQMVSSDPLFTCEPVWVDETIRSGGQAIYEISLDPEILAARDNGVYSGTITFTAVEMVPDGSGYIEGSRTVQAAVTASVEVSDETFEITIHREGAGEDIEIPGVPKGARVREVIDDWLWETYPDGQPVKTGFVFKGINLRPISYYSSWAAVDEDSNYGSYVLDDMILTRDTEVYFTWATAIQGVSIQIAPPRPGYPAGTPAVTVLSGNAVLEGTPYWAEDSSGDLKKYTGNIEEPKTYYAIVDLKSGFPYAFAEECPATVNGVPVDAAHYANSYNFEVPFEAHTRIVGVPAVQPTCGKDGNTAYWACNSCGRFFSDGSGIHAIEPGSWVLPATGLHQLTRVEEKDATCTEPGNIEGWTCEVCGEHYRDSQGGQEIPDSEWFRPATGHSYADVLTPATLSADGRIESTCQQCGHVASVTTISRPKTFKLSTTAYTYNGAVKKPSVKVVDADGKTIDPESYTVTYATGRKNVGKYKVTVKMTGNYSGTKTLYFKINPKGRSIKSLTAASKAITVKWTKQATKMSTSYISGYQIYAATDSKFTKNVKKVYVPKYSSTSKKLTALKGGKKYYVKIRTYKTVSGVKYYSPWSTVKTVTTKK